MMFRSRGFTLLEIIGVMAVIAILSSVLAPSVVDTINRSYATAEEENLATLGEVLRESVRVTRSVPSPAIGNWTTALAAQSEFTANQIRFNRRNQQRALFVHPQFFTAAEVAFGGYVQTTGLADRPFRPRLMLVSNMTGGVPALPNTQAAFDAVWDQVPGAAIVEGPDLKIERIYLGDLFHEVLLTNANTASSGFAINSGPGVAVPPAVGGFDGEIETVVIEGSQLQLFVDPFPTGLRQTTLTVQRNLSRRYNTDGTEWFWGEL